MGFLESMQGRKIHIESVTVEDQTVFVRPMDGFQRDAFDDTISDWKKDRGDKFLRNGFRGLLVACSICDEEGKFLYSVEDALKFSALDYIVIEPIFSIARKLNQFESSVETAKK